MDVTLYAQTIISSTFRPFEFYIAASVIYLLMTSLLTQFSSWIERRQERYQ